MKIFFLALLLAQSAFAGDERGNGGDVVVCREPSGKISSIEMLDYFEAREMRSIRIGLPDGSTPQEIATRALARLYIFSPQRAADYAEFIENFEAAASFRSGMEFVDIPDSDHLFFPVGCKVEQLIIQQQVVFPEDYRFFVNKDLWSAMENEQKAAGILHEAIYSELMAAGQKDSRKARYFHSKLVEDSYQPMTDKDFVSISRLTQMPLCEMRQLYVPCDSGDIPDNALTFDEAGNLLSIDGTKAGFQIFHPLVKAIEANGDGDYPKNLAKVTFLNSPRGMVTRLQFESAAAATITIAGQLVSLAPGSELVSYPDRSLRFTTIAPQCFVNSNDGSLACGPVSLKADGSVK